jgi:hypothetical protein
MIRRFLINLRLKRTMKPDPQYRINRLRQFSPERRERYFENVRRAGL